MYLVNEASLAFQPKSVEQEKKLKRNTELYHEKCEAKKAQAEKQALLMKEAAEKLVYYEDLYSKEAAEIEAKKQSAYASQSFYKPAEPKVMLVVRIKGVNKLCPRVRKIFQLFRLFQIHNAAFVRINKATLQMLKHIEPFVACGYPSVETIRKLIYKRGYVRDGMAGKQSRIRISNNEIITKKLGHLGVTCVEDMVYQIYTSGKAFKEVNNFLWTFKLRCPKGGFVCKRHGFSEFRSGDWGNREEYINELVQRMI